MMRITELIISSEQILRRRVLYITSHVLIACFIGVMNPGLLLAGEEMPKEWIRSEAGKDDKKPAHVMYRSIVGIIATFDRATALFLVQRHLRVTKQRAGEIFDYFVSIDGKIETENLQTQLDVLCPQENRPTGARIGIDQNTVDDLLEITEGKYFTLAKLFLDEKELQALDTWIEERQPSVYRLTYDHTKTQSDEEADYNLEAICTGLEIRKENAS